MGSITFDPEMNSVMYWPPGSECLDDAHAWVDYLAAFATEHLPGHDVAFVLPRNGIPAGLRTACKRIFTWDLTKLEHESTYRGSKEGCTRVYLKRKTMPYLTYRIKGQPGNKALKGIVDRGEQ